jgi:hypothetical protein
LVVDTHAGAVHTAVNHAVSTDEDLARWLSSIFARAAWQPEALVLVGSGSDLEAITPHLEDVLAVPVFVPAEAQLALARGAAMASAHGPEVFLDETGEDSGRVPTTAKRKRPMTPVGAASVLLGAGVVTFVVSGSLALGLQLTSGESAKPAEKPAAAKTVDAPAAVKAVVPAPAAPHTVEALSPPPPEELPPPSPDAAIEPAPVADQLPPDAPAPDPLAPVDPAAGSAGLAPNGVPLPPGVTDPVPGILPQPVNQVPEQKTGLLQRIKERLSGGGQPDPAQAPADAVPPPQDPLVVPPPADAPPPPPPG